MANEVQIFEDGALIATHPVMEVNNQRRNRCGASQGRASAPRSSSWRRPRAWAPALDFYEAVARPLAGEEPRDDPAARPHPPSPGRPEDAEGAGGP